jgi:spore protease
MAFHPIQVYTDMAIEARDLVRANAAEEIPGVQVRQSDADGIHWTEVRVTDDSAAKLLGKPRGRYVTLDVPHFRDRRPETRETLLEQLTEQLTTFIPADCHHQVLVVGLGNWNATPDALGPRVVERVMVTRHLSAVVDEDVRSQMRPVSAVAPGVLGTTGIETLDIIRGIVQETRPDLVVAIDALAARSMDRLLGSVQIADSGIHPGAGVGNRRQSVTEASVGVPVLAIGVCTVVQAIAIAQEAVKALADQLADDVDFYHILHQLTEAEQKGLIEEVLGSRFSDFMVTPKEIDVLIEDMADVIGEALNRALQPKLDRSQWQL